MTEPLFFKTSPGMTIAEIAALTGGVVREGADPDLRITHVAPLDHAGPGELTFADKPKFAALLATTHAAACLLPQRLVDVAPAHLAVISVRQPYVAYIAVAQALHPDSLRPASVVGGKGVSPAAFVDATARLEPGVIVDPGAVIGAGAEIGARTLIGAHAVIGPQVRIGRDCAIGPSATVTHALIGDRVILHPGVRVGQDGFGYVPGPKGYIKVPQLARVILQDDVEIGANSTVDRGGSRDTVIGEGTKIDNLVQIGHNVTIGRRCVIASLTGVSGSTVIGDHAVLGGQVGVADHISIGAGAMLAARSGVISNVPAGARWGGFPARPLRDWLRGEALMRRMVKGYGVDRAGGDDSGEEETG